MIYYCTQIKATVKPNTVQCSSLFLDVHLHVQVAIFSYGIVCVRYLFFLFKKQQHTTPFVSIAMLHSLLPPSRGFSSCRNTAHTLHYC